jgi:hypothetical protein
MESAIAVMDFPAKDALRALAKQGQQIDQAHVLRLPFGKYFQPEQALCWVHLGFEMSLERSQRRQAADHCTASPMAA